MLLFYDYSREELLDTLRVLEADVEEPASKEDMAKREGFPSPATYRRRFGSWNKARRKAGLEPVTGEQYSREELIGFLRDKGRTGGRPAVTA